MMETDGRTIGVAINSLVMQLNGMILMAMATAITGAILTGITLVILIGQVNLFPML